MAELLNENDLSQVSGGAYIGPVYEYTFKKGDILSKLAIRCGTTVDILMELNPQIIDKNKTYPGKVIKIPVK